MNKFPENAKIGLEVHMQLNTGKLFCNCDQDGNPKEKAFVRRLLSLSGESGSKDISAEYEGLLDHMFRYVESTNSCLVEADEEPPLPMNQKALETALSIAQALKSSILDQVTVMRKVVIDGSNTSGFQRTSIISIGGYVETSKCRANIMMLSLEEDSCRRIGERSGFTEFSLDRLGIPLIEISTAPDMKTPEEAIEIARSIGEYLTVMGRLRKGADAIRQDVNFSMGFGRIEIKGVSKLSAIKDILENESERQRKLKEAVDILGKRGGTGELQFKDLSSENVGINSKILERGIMEGKIVYGTIAKNLRGLMKKDGFTIGREIADSLKGLGIKGIIHHDELPNYGFTIEDRDNIAKILNLEEYDSFILITADPNKIEAAASTIEMRLKKFISLDFSETRAAMEDNSTRFMRPLSGSSRMYPETDIPIFDVTKEIMKRSRSMVPGNLDEEISKLVKKYGISQQDGRTMIVSQRKEILEDVEKNGNGKLITRILIQTVPEVEKKNGKTISDENLKKVLKFCSERDLGRYSMEKGIDLLSRGVPINDITGSDSLFPLDKDQLEKIISELGAEDMQNMKTLISKLSSMTDRPVDPSSLATILNTKKNKGLN